jgi:hypothetical protein
MRPGELRNKGADARHLGVSDQEGEAAGVGEQACCSGKDEIEALDCAEGYHFGPAGVVGGAAGKYFDMGQCEGADHLPQESDLLLIGFDQGEVNVGSPDPDGQAGEASAGADVNH